MWFLRGIRLYLRTERDPPAEPDLAAKRGLLVQPEEEGAVLVDALVELVQYAIQSLDRRQPTQDVSDVVRVFDPRGEHDDPIAVVTLVFYPVELELCGKERPERLLDALFVLGGVAERPEIDVVERNRSHGLPVRTPAEKRCRFDDRWVLSGQAPTVAGMSDLSVSERLEAGIDRAIGSSKRLEAIDTTIATWMDRWSVPVLRVALGIVFVWFGGLKVFGVSPAAELVAETVYLLPPEIFVPVLGVWEVLIGLCLLYRPLIRVGIFLLFFQMPGTFLPLVLLPDVAFVTFPYALTVEGQYIVKNLVIIGAALVVGGTVRQRDGFE